MALSVTQGEEYLGHDRWRWSIWVDGSREELDSIEHVVYILHPTFPNPVRTVSDRATNFRLETAGWGVFTVHASVKYRDGHEAALTHELTLHYPDGSPTFA